MESAAAVARLLGPPVIRAAHPPHDSAGDGAAASHPFLQLLDAAFNPPPPPAPAASGSKPMPRMARTENDSATYADSGNPCLDFFFQVVPDTPADRVRGLVAAAWERDPLTALKLVCNLRGVRGTGKSDKEGFYAAALWMHEHHPRTLACNVAALAEFGYLKDFPELLFRLIHGNDVRKLAKAKAAAHKMRKAREEAATLAGRKRSRGHALSRGGGSILDAMAPSKPLLSDFVAAVLSKTKTKSKSKAKPETSGSNPSATMEIEKPEEAAQPVAMEVDGKPEKEKEVDGKPEKKEVSKKARKAGKLAVQSLEKYYGDRAYRFLFDCVAEFFAELLASDLEQLAPGGKRRKIGLAAKWCPTPGSSFDRTTLLCEAIARRLFPRDSSPDYAQLSEEHYAYSVLRRLRREALVPLRDVLQLPEVYMSAQRWSELPYTRVASVAMRRYKALFKKHDEDRFAQYLADVEEGKAKIAAGALLPHEIASAAMRGEEDDVSELQWRRMVDDLRAKGSLRNCISVCDVSGSMSGTPMDVCVALGVLTSELSEEPWAGRVITFSARPQIHMIKGNTLAEKLRFVQRMDWCMNTNFQAVFDQILRTAVDGRLPPEKMIRTVFVFSDMEFDQASTTNHWETDYEAICRKFGSAGYGDAVPQIVFWNLRDSKSTPVTSTQPGVAMVSGFSKNLLKIFLQNDGVVNPEAVMAAAIAGEEYQKLVVFD
uniref:TROVE domain-containing protein n=1 Tax=Oryza punctata TaxID=4537 RepID=A0A0E0M2Z4_ORYPU